MKVCSICSVNKPLTEFRKQKTGTLGHRADCNECVKRFVRSETGLINQMYSGMKARSKRKGFTPINFSKDEFIDFLNSSTPIADLYDAWVKSGYESDLKPSVDRLDDYQGYSLGNIQVTTQKQNIDKYYQDAVEGKNTKTAVSVLQYTLDNQFVKEHHSISEAARSVGSSPTNIRLAAINYEIKRKNPDGSYRTDKRKHCRGFKWKLKTP